MNNMMSMMMSSTSQYNHPLASSSASSSSMFDHMISKSTLNHQLPQQPQSSSSSSASSSTMKQILEQCIKDSLNNHLTNNALFLAERLCALDSSSTRSHYTLASIYYRLGKPTQCYNLLLSLNSSVSSPSSSSSSSSSSPSYNKILEIKQLLGQCCYDLDKLLEAEIYFKECCDMIDEYEEQQQQQKQQQKQQHDEDYRITPCTIASIYYLLAMTYKKNNQRGKTIEYLKKSLSVYPYLWISYEQLCNMGQDINPNQYFIFKPSLYQQQQQQSINPTIVVSPTTINLEQEELTIGHLSTAANNNTAVFSSSLIEPPSPFPIPLNLNTPVSTTTTTTSTNNNTKMTTTPSYREKSNTNNEKSKAMSQSVTSAPVKSKPSRQLHHHHHNPTTTTPGPHQQQKQFNLATTPSSNYPAGFSSSISGMGDSLNPLNFDIPMTPQTPSLAVTPIVPPAVKKQQQHQQQHHLPNLNTPATTPGVTPGGPSSNVLKMNIPESPIPMALLTPGNNITPNITSTATPSPAYHHHHQNPAAPTKLQQSHISAPMKKKNNNKDTLSSIPLSLQMGVEPIDQMNIGLEKKKPNNNNNKKHVHIGGIEEILIDQYYTQKSDQEQHQFKPLTESDLMINELTSSKSTTTSTTKTQKQFNNNNSNNNSNNNNNNEQQLKQQQQAHTELLNLLLILANSYRLLCLYSCKEALESFKTLPWSQYNTGWVLTRVGKAYFELVDYHEANHIFEQVRTLEPYRLEGTEIHSTILWHLKRDVDLSYLAHQLIEFDRLSPHAWCVVGNCFSLQKDHESALKIFKRAIQLDSSFTYAYTLCGHEYLSNDDLDNAQTYYRSALKIDSRHYNAWYGLGLIYFRLEKYDLAEYHFRKALSINPQSSVLYCHIGMTLQSNRKHLEALSMLQQAIDLQPRNTLAKFKKASILYQLGQYEEALVEVDQFKELAPKETPLYILMGKIYKKLGQLDMALNCLTTALDMDNKNSTNSNYIRSIIDHLYVDDDEDEENK